MLGRRKYSRGVTLIEILVSVIILAFGLLGLAGLQSVGLRNNTSAIYRTQATYLAQDIVDRMRVNRDSAISGDYDQTMTAGKPTGSTLADTDVNAWLTNIERELPAGDGSIACTTTTNVCVITVQWTDSSAAAAQQFVTSTEI